MKDPSSHPRALPSQDDRSGLFSWIKPVFSTKDSYVLQNAGLDAFFFLRFLRTVLKIFVPTAAAILPILLPLSIVHGKKPDAGVQGLNRLTWGGVGLDHSNYYWAYLVLALVVVVQSFYTIYEEFRYYVQIRHKHLSSRSTSHTVLISDIPHHLCSKDRLSATYEKLVGGAYRIWINRDCKMLARKIKQRDKFVAQLEAAETRLISRAIKSRCKSGNLDDTQDKRESVRLPYSRLTWLSSIFPLGEKVDLIYHYRREVSRLSIEIAEDQHCANQNTCLHSALIQFERSIDAQVVSRSVVHASPFQLSPQYVDNSISAVVWDHVGLKWWECYIRSVLVMGSMAAIIVGWAIPVAFTGFLSQLGTLTAWFPSLVHYAPWLLGFLQGILPQAILAILTILLPSIVRLLVEQQGFALRTTVELTIQKYYFCFLFIQVFLTVALSSSAATIFGQIYHNLDTLPTFLAINLPKTSNYFLSYLMLHAFSISAGGLVQMSGLLQYLVISPAVDHTPREQLQRRVGISKVTWATVYPVYTNLACIGTQPEIGRSPSPANERIGIIYSVIAPLVLILVVIAFGMFWVVFRYNILYVTKSISDTGGLLYPTALNHLFVGIYTFEIFLVGLFLLARDKEQRWVCLGQAVIMIATTGVTGVFQVVLNRAFGPLLGILPHAEGCEPLKPESLDEDAWSICENDALRACRPTIWIPRDPLGISDNEVFETRESNEELWISNDKARICLKRRIVIDGD